MHPDESRGRNTDGLDAHNADSDEPGPFDNLEPGGRLALDIETISPDVPADERPDFDDSTQFELLCTALAYEPPSGGDRQHQVIFRSDHTPETEAEHLRTLAANIATVAPETIITFGGEAFDFHHLRGRASILADLLDDPDLPDEIDAVLSEPTHLDLQPAAWDAYGNYTSLEHTCFENDIEPAETRFEAFDHGHPLAYRDDDQPGHVTSSDVPEVGEALLRYVGGERDGAAAHINPTGVVQLLADYATGDVQHLFTLADRHPFEA